MKHYAKEGTNMNANQWLQRRLIPARSVTTLLLLGVLTIGNLGPAQVQAAGPAVQRPISDFLDAQGTTMVFNAPVPDQLGWANNPDLSNKPPFQFALFDYAGLANDYLISHRYPSLGTTTDGTITERPLADGRAEVHVILHTTNALAFSATAPRMC
jgi:hypothetical protein